MIVCLGEALIDLIPPAGTPISNTPSLSVQPGGAPFNVAVALARIGVPATFAGSLSNDGFGQRLAGILDDAGVARVPEQFVAHPTRLAIINPVDTGSPFRFYGERPADTRLTRHDVDQAVTTNTDGLYVSSLMMIDHESAEVQRYAIERATRLNIQVFTDPNPRPSAWENRTAMRSVTAWLLEQAAIAKLSLDDARALGWPDEPDALLQWVSPRLAASLVVTDGARGCWFEPGDGIEHVRSFPTTPVDPTGAGDAFFAALIAKCHGRPELTRDVLRFASAAGALTCARQGATSGLPTLDELDQLIDKH